MSKSGWILTKEELKVEEEAKKRARQTRIDNTKLALLYCRQSTRKQTVKNKESALSQTVGAKRRATVEYEFSEEKLVLFIENALDKRGNKLDEDRWRSVSGTIAIIFRPGLREVQRYIEADLAGALFVDDVSRLFRDEIGITSREFVATCKAHHCVIVTEDREYDFNATARDDREAFLEECDEAAEYLKFLNRTLHRRKEKKGNRGGFTGHPVPTGHMLTEDRSRYEPNPYWAPVVKRITKRFRELDADFATLRNEVRSQAIFPDLPEDFDLTRIGRIQLWKVPGGYTVLGRQSLIYLLTNPANAGHTKYKGHLIKDTHLAIVDIDDYEFAVAHLRDADLDGNEIEREKRAKRFTQGQKREGLLAGVRLDGRPVVTSSQGMVYVFQTADGGAMYRIRNDHDLNPDRGSISLEPVDTAISRRLEEKLHALMLHFEAEQELGGSPRHGAQAVLSHVASLKKWVQAGLAQIDKLIAAVEKDLKFREKEYEIAKHVMAPEDIEAYYKKRAESINELSRLRVQRSAEDRTHKDIDIVQKRLNTAKELWGAWDLEQRRAFIRLITNTITLDTLSRGFMKLTIEWSLVLAGEYYTECALFLRGMGAGARWKPQEDALLRELYPDRPKSEILAIFPSRSWAAIKWRARLLPVRRFISEPASATDPIAQDDLAVMQQYNISLEWIEAGYTEFWGIETQNGVINWDDTL